MAEKHNIEAIAELACLKIEANEVSDYEGHFEKILQYFAELQKADTTGVEPLITPHNQPPPLRSDNVQVDLSVEEILENAPDVKDSLFKVPPVV